MFWNKVVPEDWKCPGVKRIPSVVRPECHYRVRSFIAKAGDDEVQLSQISLWKDDACYGHGYVLKGDELTEVKETWKGK